MKSTLLRNATAVWIGLGLASLLTNCASQQSKRGPSSAQLPLGLYKVVERECSYPRGTPEDCSQTQCIEVVKGVFRSLEKDEAAFVIWLSDNPQQKHVFIVRELRQGKFVGAQEYVIEDDPLGKEWLVVSDTVITNYFFIRHPRRTPQGEMAGKTHLTLTRIPRTDEINRLLQYPAAER